LPQFYEANKKKFSDVPPKNVIKLEENVRHNLGTINFPGIVYYILRERNA
jgi:hypothetical protein